MNENLFYKKRGKETFILGNRDSEDPFHLTIISGSSHLTNEKIPSGNLLRNYTNLETKIFDAAPEYERREIADAMFGPPKKIFFERDTGGF